jgi:hypothetical protein
MEIRQKAEWAPRWQSRVQLKCDGTRWRTGGEVKGKLANGVGRQCSSHCLGVSTITTADAHTPAASSRLNWRPRRFKGTRPFRRKKKSGFCACAITFQTYLHSVCMYVCTYVRMFCLRVKTVKVVRCMLRLGEPIGFHSGSNMNKDSWTLFLATTAIPNGGRRLRLKCDGTRAETRFRLSAKRTSPLTSAGASVHSTTGSRGVRISGGNAGHTMFRGSVKSSGYPLYSPVSPSLPLPCVTVCHHISTVL